MGWLIALGIFVALACLPLGISLRYDAEGFHYRFLAGWISFQPSGKKTKEKPEKKEKKKMKKTTQVASGKKASKKGGALSDFLPFVNSVLDFLEAFRGKLRIRRLEMKLIMAGDDPCDLAVNFGRAWAALGNLIPLLERCFVIKKRNLEVECDFETSQTLIFARVDLTITLGRLVRLLLHHGTSVLKEYMNLKKPRKGGISK